LVTDTSFWVESCSLHGKEIARMFRILGKYRRGNLRIWMLACWKTLLLFVLNAVVALACTGVFSAEKPDTSDTSRASPRVPDAFQLLLSAKQRYDREVKDYFVYFFRQECVNPDKDATLGEPEKIEMKFRKEPFSVMMKWVDGPRKGSRALYVEGWNKNRVRIHPSGIAGIFIPRIDLDPESKWLSKYSRHSITEAGIGNLMDSLLSQFRLARSNRDLNVEYLGEEKVGTRAAYKFRRTLQPGRGYYCHELLLWLDTDSGYPLAIQTSGWDGLIWERYRYEDFRFNNSYTQEDFKW